MTDCEMLFKRLRNVALTAPERSERYKDWVRKLRPLPDTQIHHVFGSAMSLKSTDFLIVAVGGEEHALHQNDPDWCMKQMPDAIRNLIRYVVELEGK